MFWHSVGWQTGKFLELADFFKQPIPGLNLNGKVKNSTICGSLISISMLLVLAVYADYKLKILVNRQHANVSDFVQENALSREDKLNL